MNVSGLIAQGSIIPAWEEFATPVTPEPVTRKKANKYMVHEQCFRCTLPDCDESSQKCLIFVETGVSANGKSRRPRS